MQKHLQILYKSIRLKVQIKGVQNMEKLLDLAVQYDGVKTKILPNGVQFKKDKKSVTYYPSTGTVASDEKGKIKVYKRAGMELLEKELHAAFYQPVDLYKTSEYLVDIRGKWELQLLTDDTPESETCVRVPDGAEIAVRFNDDVANYGVCFYKNNGGSVSSSKHKCWQHDANWKMHELLDESHFDGDIDLSHSILWQRMESTSDLPFTTPELSEEYQALCDRVEVINKEAARYMREEAPMLDSFNNDGPLIESFNWAEPPHGYNYWSKLEKALLEPSSYNHIGEAKEAPSAAIGGKVAATLDEREHQYGSFEKVAATTVQLMAIIGSGESASKLSDSQNEALHMICSKIARIVNGDVKYLDNWHDISGYATLIEMELSK